MTDDTLGSAFYEEEKKKEKQLSMRVFERKVLSQTRGEGMNERDDIDGANKTNKKETL
jgi:hypothetical protein